MNSIQKLLVIIFLSVRTIVAEDRYEQMTIRGIQAAYNMQVDKATEIFDEMIRIDAGDPRGYVLQSVNYFYRFQLKDQPKHFEQKFRRYITDAIKISKKSLSDKQRGPDALFCLGTAHIYYAAYHGEKGNWLKAYFYGKDGIAFLEKVVERDSAYYDAYLGLGLYHYYADVMPDVIKTVSSILGIEGDRERGLRELRLAAEKVPIRRPKPCFS